MIEPTEYHLPTRLFPFTIELFALEDAMDAPPIWTATVESAGELVIPKLGRRIRSRVTFPDGVIIENEAA